MLNEKESNELNIALQFLHVSELKDILEKLSLPTKGKKGSLISRILHFLKTGNIINEPIMGCDIAPDWNKTEIQKHIQVNNWIFINNPSTKYFKRKTLVEIKDNSINNIINH